MEILARQLLFGVCAVALAVAFANVAHGEAAPPVVVGLAKCSACTRNNMNAEAAFKGLQVAVKCKNSKGEYESKAMGNVDRTGAFSVPLAADLVGEDGELKQDCLAQLHSASSAPCPGQEPSKIVAAQPGRDGRKTFVALAGKMNQPSAECASAFLCHSFHKHLHHLIFHKHLHHLIPPKHDHDDHDHAAPPVPEPEHKPPSTAPVYPPPGPKHDHDDHDHSAPPVTEPEHKPPSTPVYTPPVTEPEHKPPSTPVYTPTPQMPTPIYHPPAQRDAVTDPQQFKKLLPSLKKLPFFPPGELKKKP